MFTNAYCNNTNSAMKISKAETNRDRMRQNQPIFYIHYYRLFSKSHDYTAFKRFCALTLITKKDSSYSFQKKKSSRYVWTLKMRKQSKIERQRWSRQDVAKLIGDVISDCFAFAVIWCHLLKLPRNCRTLWTMAPFEI